MKPQVLQLDVQGTPQAWISLEHAASNYATGSVVWEDGAGPLATMRGGFNVASGAQSRIDISPIIALKGCAGVNLFDHAPSAGASCSCAIGTPARTARSAFASRI